MEMAIFRDPTSIHISRAYTREKCLSMCRDPVLPWRKCDGLNPIIHGIQKSVDENIV
jgi:hypothetical protein